MDLRRLRAAEWIVAVSGAGLLVSLFLPWYDGYRTAWQALTANDVILAVIGLAALALFLITATQRVPAIPIAFEALTALLGLLAVIVVVIRVVWLPEGVDGREWGLWLGLVAAVALAGGAWIGVRDEQTPTEAAPPPPEVEPLPTPRT